MVWPSAINPHLSASLPAVTQGLCELSSGRHTRSGARFTTRSRLSPSQFTPTGGYIDGSVQKRPATLIGVADDSLPEGVGHYSIRVHTEHTNPERNHTREGRAAAKSVSSTDKSRDSPSPLTEEPTHRAPNCSPPFNPCMFTLSPAFYCRVHSNSHRPNSKPH